MPDLLQAVGRENWQNPTGTQFFPMKGEEYETAANDTSNHENSLAILALKTKPKLHSLTVSLAYVSLISINCICVDVTLIRATICNS